MAYKNKKRRREYVKGWLKKNKRRIKERRKKYYFKNKQEIEKKREEYALQHPIIVKRWKEKYYKTHKKEFSKRAKIWVQKNKKKKARTCRAYYVKNRKYLGKLQRIRLLHKYGLTPKQYREMYYKRDGHCDICGKVKRVLNIDHSHESSKIRGLLCHGCNVSLGFMQDSISNLEKAIAYLKRSG